MSKYELRAAEIKASAKQNDWSIAWHRQGARIYVKVNTSKGNPLLGGHNDVYAWLLRWYPDPSLTSGGFGHWTFMVCDIMQALRSRY